MIIAGLGNVGNAQDGALETIYVLPDGSVSPDTPLIMHTGDFYLLTGNINATIIIQKEGITFDGNGYTLYGNNTPYGPAVSGFVINGVDNITIMNTRIINYSYGVFLQNTMGNNILNNYFDYDNYAVGLHGSANFNIIANNTMTRGLQGVYTDYGFNNNSTIIYNNITNLGGSGVGINLIQSTGNIIQGNTMDHNNKGVNLYHCTNSIVSGNIITYMDQTGIHLTDSHWNTIAGNKINRTHYAAGIVVSSSSENTVFGNDLCYNEEGIRVESLSTLNTVFGNNLIYNDYGVRLYNHADNNTFHHNNFIYSINYQVFFLSTDNLYNKWNSTVEGNYWSDYSDADLNYDGIGDSWYEIDSSNMDYRPLMGRFSDFKATSEHYVQTICNSSITDFQFNGTAISFYVTGEDGTAGFCRTCIPKALMNATYTVFVNDSEVSSHLLSCSNSTHNYLYFNYTHSTQQVVIIPEFPLASILPFTLLSAIAIIATKKRFKR